MLIVWIDSVRPAIVVWMPIAFGASQSRSIFVRRLVMVGQSERSLPGLLCAIAVMRRFTPAIRAMQPLLTLYIAARSNRGRIDSWRTIYLELAFNTSAKNGCAGNCECREASLGVDHFCLATDISPTVTRPASDSNRRESLGEGAALSELWFDDHLALLVDKSPFASRIVADANFR
jgi:hypothetical protein